MSYINNHMLVCYAMMAKEMNCFHELSQRGKDRDRGIEQIRRDVADALSKETCTPILFLTE